MDEEEEMLLLSLEREMLVIEDSSEDIPRHLGEANFIVIEDSCEEPTFPSNTKTKPKMTHDLQTIHRPNNFELFQRTSNEILDLTNDEDFGQLNDCCHSMLLIISFIHFFDLT